VIHVRLTDVGHWAAAAFNTEFSAELSRLVAPLAEQDREHRAASPAGTTCVSLAEATAIGKSPC
jgi:hypothetical protein